MERRPGLVVRIKIKDEQGRVVGEADAVTYKGLLSLAHDDGLQFVRTEIVQVPTEDNRRTAIARAIVRTRRGTFTGIGDANPDNVNRRIVPHIIRMAETRSVARALRLAVNIGEVAIEELAEDVSFERTPPQKAVATLTPEAAPGAPHTSTEPAAPARPERFRGRDTHPTEAAQGDRRAMSEEQRKLLFRLAFDLGENRETAADRVLKTLGVERFEWATRADASRAIDALKRATANAAPRPSSGNGHPANGGSHG
ncbi:MAG: hypothetical protein IT379_30500 [Deltaproteobacteria bacterium]|nr:hypothetical protein [Deltaproteobacteria bacterium]